MPIKYIVRPALATVLALSIPLLGMIFTAEVAWSFFDFVAAGILIFGAGVLYEFISHKGGSAAYKAGVGLSVFSALALVWVNLAVGIIGNEDNPANMLYLSVLAVLFLGMILARFKAEGMSRTLFAAAATQALVPVIAFFIWKPSLSIEVYQVMGASSVFAILFVGAALLFQTSAQEGSITA